MDKTNLIKVMAKRAKQRMRGDRETTVNAKGFKIITNTKTNVKTIQINQKDNALIEKMKDAFLNNSLTPLATLIDSRTYNKMSSEEKQRYFLKMADKYREFKCKYENENQHICGLN